MAAPGYQCMRCMQCFSNKGALDRHVEDRVTPCQPAPPIADLHAELLRRAFQARDILRKVGVTGKEALNCIVAVLVLREIERKFPRLADPTTYEPRRMMMPIIKEAIDIPEADKERKLPQRGRFSGIAASNEHDGANRNWSEVVRAALQVLEHHPDTRETCYALYANADKLFPLRDSKTAMQLVKFVAQQMVFPADEMVSRDVLGRLFMSIVRDMLAGKDLGQFFTPPPVVSILVQLCTKGRGLGHVYDPTCGSGGFLSAAAGAGALSETGTELDAQVHLLAFANVLLARGVTPSIDHADTLHCPLPRAPDGDGFDTVLANPPFGVKGLKWEEVVEASPDGADSFPMKCATATGLFLQRIIRAAKIGGLCAVVLPLGREVAGQGAQDKKLRHAILRACDLRGVIMFPANTFETTSIKTCALILQKKCELGEVLKETGVKRKTQGVDKSVPYATMQSKLLTIDASGSFAIIPDTRPIVSIAEIEATGWSFSPEDYRTAPAAPAMQSAYPMAKLGDICTMQSGKYNSKDKADVGAFPFFSASARNPVGFHDTPSFSAPEYIILVKDGGNSKSNDTNVGMGRAWYMTSPAAFTSHVLALIAAPPVNTRYLATYLDLTAADTRAAAARFTTGLGTMSMTRLKEVPIPLPPLEVQQRIGATFAELTRDIESIEAAGAALDKQARITLERELYGRGGLVPLIYDGAHPPARYPMAKLGDICTMRNGKALTKKNIQDGPFPVIGGGIKPMGHHNESNTPAGATLVSATGACGAVTRYDSPVFINSDCVSISAGAGTDAEYVHWCLKHLLEPQMQKLRTGMAQPHLAKAKVMELCIPLPPLDVQQRIGEQVKALADQAATLKRQASDMRAALPEQLREVLAGSAEAPSDKEPAAAAAQ